MRLRLESSLESQGLSIAAYGLLKLAGDLPGSSASNLSRRVMVSQQAAAKLTTRLSAQRLLKAEVDTANARVRHFHLTTEGRRVVAEADQIIERWEKRLRAQLGVENVLAFLKFLDLTLAMFSERVIAPKQSRRNPRVRKT